MVLLVLLIKPVCYIQAVWQYQRKKAITNQKRIQAVLVTYRTGSTAIGRILMWPATWIFKKSHSYFHTTMIPTGVTRSSFVTVVPLAQLSTNTCQSRECKNKHGLLLDNTNLCSHQQIRMAEQRLRGRFPASEVNKHRQWVTSSTKG